MKKGIVLVLVAGLLTLLAMTGLAFVATGRGQRDAVRTAVDFARAGLLARSGVERAASEVGRDPAPVLTYGGEDHDGDGVLDLAGVEAVTQRVRPGVLDTDTCPVRWALRPTFYSARGDEPPVGMERVPDLTRVDGVRLGYSGRLRGTYADEPGLRGDTYVLRVAEAGGIYVNGGGLDGGDDDGDGTPNHQDPDTGYNATLRRILGTFARIHDFVDGSLDGAPVGESDGFALIDTRPFGGWRSWDEIRDTALGGSREKADYLRPFLGLRAWVDKKVIVPTATPEMVGRRYHTWGEFQMDHRIGPDGTRRPSFETVGGRVVGRAPVVFPWARSRPTVLMALMSNLKGVYLDETDQRVWTGMDTRDRDGWWTGPTGLLDYVGTAGAFEVPAGLDPLAATGLTEYVNAITQSSAPLRTWGEWDAFCNSMFVGGAGLLNTVPNDGGFTYGQQKPRNVLKANFDPNTNFNGTNPCATGWRLIDKTDLLTYSTEFILFPVNGYDIESAGRVTGVSGGVLAVRTVRASLAPASAVELTTQREFACEDLGDLQVAGDEGPPRMPGFHIGGAPAYLSESQGTSRTWGHRLDSTGASPAANHAGGWMDGDSLGAGLQLYPEPHHRRPGGGPPGLNAADYDGSLMRATIETRVDDTYGAAAGPAQMKALALFDDAFDLDDADGDPACVVRERQVPPDDLGLSVADRNTLCPDGAFCEWERTPAYHDRDNAHGFRGVMSFWQKPHYWMQKYSYANGSFHCRARICVSRTNARSLAPDRDGSQVWYVGEGGAILFGGSVIGPTFFFESGFVGPDGAHDRGVEHSYCHGASIPHSFLRDAHQWRLATVFWDCRTREWGRVGRYVLATPSRGVLDRTSNTYVVTAAENKWDTSQDITQDDLGGPHLMLLGPMTSGGPWAPPVTRDSGGGFPRVSGRGADSTMDDLVIYDFGGAEPGDPVPADSYDAARLVAEARWAEGRYYPGAAYTPAWGARVADEAPSWVSAPISLPPGAVVRRVLWSWRTPQPEQYAEIELIDRDMTRHLWGDEAYARSTRDPAWRRDRAEWNVGRAPGEPFRVRAVFRADGASGPLYDTPILDDVTLIVDSGAAGIAAWSEE